MARKNKIQALSIDNVNDLPEEYEIISIKKDSPFFVHQEHREAICVISETTQEDDAVNEDFNIWIIVNINSRYKMNYKHYLNISKDHPGPQYRVVKCKEQEILDSIYISVYTEDEDDIDKFDSEVINEVNDLISEAIVSNVSDVHIEVRESMSKIRFRKNGALFTKSQITYLKGEKMGVVLYQALSTESGVVFNPSVPQDAMVDSKFNGTRARLRIATAPASPGGFDMVIRILKFGEKTSYTLLTDLGYTMEQSEAIYNFSSDPIGATIIAGTTGSGKSTTLKNLITKKIMDYKATLKVITVEDPPEYEIPHATQIPVIRDDSGSAVQGFSSAIRTAMRSDPDILMIGEVRDNQSSALLVSATQSGHQVLSTVHAPSAVGIIGRLESLGINRDVLSSSDFISGLIYQKLLPKICQYCALPYLRPDGQINNPISEESMILSLGYCTEIDIGRAKTRDRTTPISRVLQDMGVLDEDQVSRIRKEYNKSSKKFKDSGFSERINKALNGNLSMVKFKGGGCSECSFTGLAGRLVVAEILRPNEEILESIKLGDDMLTRKAWKESALGATLIENTLYKISLGIVDPVHAEKEIGSFDGDT